MRIRLIWEGRTKDRHLLALQADYQARIAHFTPVAIEDLAPAAASRSNAKRGLSSSERRLLDRVEGSRKVVLDEAGKEWTSREFARWIDQCASRGTQEIAFVVGGPEGFSDTFRSRADLLLSLSRMTLTRDWARTLLLEQIYRAYTLQRGYPYPR